MGVKRIKKNSNKDKIIGASIGLVIGLVILFFMYGNSNHALLNSNLSNVVPTVAPIENFSDLNIVSTDLDNTNPDELENELFQLDSEASF